MKKLLLQLTLLLVTSGALGMTMGCSMVPSWAGGDSGTIHIRLDDEFEAKRGMELGQMIVISVRKPRAEGYTLAGARFDPSMLRLDSVMEAPGDPEYMNYGFMTLESGMTLLTIRAAKEGQDSEAYKAIKLDIDAK